jgi:hypothetical protein
MPPEMTPRDAARIIVSGADEAALESFLECLNVRRNHSFEAMLAAHAAAVCQNDAIHSFPHDLKTWALTYRLNSETQIRQALALIECGYAEELYQSCRSCGEFCTVGLICPQCAQAHAAQIIAETAAMFAEQCRDCGAPSQQAICEDCLERRR